METKLGFAACPIAVPDGTLLVGYEGEAPRYSSGTHDPLYSKALMLEQGGRRFALVCSDLLAMDPDLAGSVARGAAALGIQPDDLFLSATHTHAGPGGFFSPDPRFGDLLSVFFGPLDPAIRAAVEGSVLDALTEAAKDLLPCTLSAAAQKNDGIGTDRNQPELPGDPLLTLLRFARTDGVCALLYNTACHPTVLSGANTLVSADYPGATAAALKENGVDFALFLNGSAGDVSTRFTRRESSFAEVDRLGGLLAQQILEKTCALPDGQADFPLDSSDIELPMHVRHVDMAEQAADLARFRAELADAQQQGLSPAELRILQSRCEGAMHGLIYARFQPAAETLPMRVRFLRAGDFVFGFFPAEMFSALTNPVRAKFSDRFIAVSYAGGYLGYLPDAGIADRDDYEKYNAIFEYSEGDRLMETVAHHLEDHYGLQRQ